jgi:enterochelin esterase family protein
MKRFLSVSVLFLLSVGSVRSQDMALSQIVIDGEGWKVVPNTAGFSFRDPAALKSLAGNLYMADKSQQMLRIGRTEGVSPVLDEFKPVGMRKPTCVLLWADESQLVVSDAEDRYLWAFRVETDGKLGPGDRYYSLRVKKGEKGSGVSALTLDTAGRVYACTPLGVQIFDPTGRLCGVLLNPGEDACTGIGFGGEKKDTLFVKCGTKVYGRQLKANGAR